MEGSLGSGGVLKKKSSSGCLIIKKKGENTSLRRDLVGLAIDSNERKSRRLVSSDSISSNEDEPSEFIRRKVNDKRFENGSMAYKKSNIENRGYVRSNVGIEIGGETKRSRLDLYDLDEYDKFRENNMGNEHVKESYRRVGHDNSVRNLKDYGVGSSNRKALVGNTTNSPYVDGVNSGRIKGVDYSGLRNKGFTYREDTVEPIRIQGKNGVLKVMVNKNKKLEIQSHYAKFDHMGVETREVSRSEKVVKRDVMARSPVYTNSHPHENRCLLVAKDNEFKEEKQEIKLKKLKSDSSNCISDKVLENVGANAVLKPAQSGLQSSSSKKMVKKEEEKAPLNAKHVSAKDKDVSKSKVKRGGSTEKQMLREKIRGMLIDAGWTIDHRPRRNRDYLDAVYINPSGTAFWSIIKAYEALKKQLGEDSKKCTSDVGSPSFAELSEDLISKLTRQTKKKIEEAERKKTKDDGLIKNGKKSAARYDAGSSDSDYNEEDSRAKQNSKSQRGKSRESYQEGGEDSSDNSSKRKSRKVAMSSIQGRTSKITGRCPLQVRTFDQGEKSNSHGCIPYNGRTVLAWLIDSGAAKVSERVQYMNGKSTQVMLEGWITRDGIHCGCCSKILMVSKFELHAGSKLRQPFQNMYLESGQSLLQCQIDAWNRQPEPACRAFYDADVDGDNPDDDTCGICGDDGALICCDSCHMTYHQICLDIQIAPSGDWHCPNCTCKYCGDEGNDDVDADELIKCTFCKRRYHKSCCEMIEPVGSSGSSFCGLTCQELCSYFQKMIGVKHDLEGGFSWSVIQRSDVSDTSHCSYAQMVECNSKLAVALSVMEECFLPIIDRRSGINIIHNVVYNCGSSFNRLNYRGFYTVIMERGDEIVAAASIRIHGTLVAEMPFIGTREMYRQQGICRRLLSSVEAELRSLKVRQLVIPAIPEHTNIWKTSFGFVPLEDALRKEIKSINMLVFSGTDMLQKQLVKHETSHGKEESKAIKIQDKSNINSSLECTKSANKNSGLFHGTRNNSPDSFTPLNGNALANDTDSACVVSEKNLSSKRCAVNNCDAETKQVQVPPSSEHTPSDSDEDGLSIKQNGSLEKDNNAKSVDCLTNADEHVPMKAYEDFDASSRTVDDDDSVESHQHLKHPNIV